MIACTPGAATTLVTRRGIVRYRHDERGVIVFVRLARTSDRTPLRFAAGATIRLDDARFWGVPAVPPERVEAYRMHLDTFVACLADMLRRMHRREFDDFANARRAGRDTRIYLRVVLDMIGRDVRRGWL